MSTTDNLHRKVLSSNALKTNFISNTNQKNKSQNEKRFSNISRQKQLQNNQRQTIQKNTARYYEEVDMQGSATILPQKNNTRSNVYATNQNSNHVIQMTSQQKFGQANQNLNIKAKSPIDKNRLQIQIGMQSNVQQKIVSHHHTTTMNYNKAISNQIKTQRQKSVKPSRPNQQKQSFKMKSLVMNKQLVSQIDEDLMCNEEMDLTILPSKKSEEHTRKLSSNLSINNLNTKHNQNSYASKTQNNFTIAKNDNNFLNKIDNAKNNSKEQIIGGTQYFNDQFNRTQKKYPIDKPTLMLEKTKSQHTISIKQPSLVPLLSNPSHPTLLTNFQSIINRQSSKHLTSNIINYEQQLKKFSHIQSQTNLSAQIQTIFRLENRQKQYMVQPNYIQLKQKHFNWFMRAVLMDWMVHVCFEFALKRETYYIAVAIADKYLQQTSDLSKSQFQLVGAASMFIAAKLQQFEALSSADFSKSTDNRYSSNDIKQMELKICRKMNYQLNPPTLYMWANRFMIHWDNYIELTNAKFHPYFQTHKPKFFKKQFQQSYLLFRQMLQMLDCSILDVQTLQFVPKVLVCSFMYLVLGKNYKQWPAKRIVEEFPRSSHYLVAEEENSCFNHLFHMFLSDSFELDIIQLLPAVQYCSTYFTLQLNFDTPSHALKGQDQEQAQLNLQEYESYQTYNGKMIDLIKRRFRGVYL